MLWWEGTNIKSFVGSAGRQILAQWKVIQYETDRQTDRQTARDRQTDRQRQIDKQMRERDGEGQVAQDCVKATGEHLERKEVDSKQKVC